jgi:GxxExxY protein
MPNDLLYKELSYALVGAAMEVHRLLGAGFPEAVYGTAFGYELQQRLIPFTREVPLCVRYKDQIVGEFKADFVVDQKIICELKAASGLHVAHSAQALHYLRATGLQLALVLNFGGEKLEFRRVIATRIVANICNADDR